jgi:hypothetical protein
MPEIGATLREARMRARIDVSEIEAQTKIRAKYLRALENEEWGLLPGPTFVKSFLRTYAQALGLDAKALVEEYRLTEESASEFYEPIAAPARSGRPRGPRGGPSRGYVAAVTVIGALIVLLIVLLATSGGSGGGHHATTTSGHRAATGATHTSTTTASAPPQPVTLSLRPTATVYVCLIGDHGRKLIAGHNLEAGETTPTYTAHRFELTLGNSSVTLFIDGRERTVPASSEAIGYAITRGRGRQRLTGSQLPTCQ